MVVLCVGHHFGCCCCYCCPSSCLDPSTRSPTLGAALEYAQTSAIWTGVAKAVVGITRRLLGFRRGAFGSTRHLLFALSPTLLGHSSRSARLFAVPKPDMLRIITALIPHKRKHSADLRAWRCNACASRRQETHEEAVTRALVRLCSGALVCTTVALSRDSGGRPRRRSHRSAIGKALSQFATHCHLPPFCFICLQRS